VAKIVGRAEAEYPLISPLSQSACVYYEVIGKDCDSETIWSETACCHFDLTDDSGTIHCASQTAFKKPNNNKHIQVLKSWEQPRQQNNVSEFTAEELSSQDVPPHVKAGILQRKGIATVYERVIQVGDVVAALGWVQNGDDGLQVEPVPTSLWGQDMVKRTKGWTERDSNCWDYLTCGINNEPQPDICFRQCRRGSREQKQHTQSFLLLSDDPDVTGVPGVLASHDSAAAPSSAATDRKQEARAEASAAAATEKELSQTHGPEAHDSTFM